MSDSIINPCTSLMVSGLLGVGFGLQMLESNGVLGEDALTMGKILYGAGVGFAAFTGGRYLLSSLVGRVSSLTPEQLKKSLIKKLVCLSISSISLMGALYYIGRAGQEYILSIVPDDNAASTIEAFSRWGMGCVVASVFGGCFQAYSEAVSHKKLLSPEQKV
jgi:hypothetical protein